MITLPRNPLKGSGRRDPETGRVGGSRGDSGCAVGWSGATSSRSVLLVVLSVVGVWLVFVSSR